MNTSLCLRLAILGNVCKINGLFTLFPHFLPSLIHKRIWHPDPDKMVILKLLVCHLLCQSAFGIKSYSWSQHLLVQIHWPIVVQAEHAWSQHYQRTSKIRKILPLDPWVDTFDLCFFQGIWSFLLPVIDTKSPFGDQNYKRSKI